PAQLVVFFDKRDLQSVLAGADGSRVSGRAGPDDGNVIDCLWQGCLRDAADIDEERMGNELEIVNHAVSPLPHPPTLSFAFPRAQASNRVMGKLLPPLLTLVLSVSALAADLSGTARVISIRKYEHGRIVYWEDRVPIYDGNPVYDI